MSPQSDIVARAEGDAVPIRLFYDRLFRPDRHSRVSAAIRLIGPGIVVLGMVVLGTAGASRLAMSSPGGDRNAIQEQHPSREQDLGSNDPRIELKLKIPGVRSVSVEPTKEIPRTDFRYTVVTATETLQLTPEAFTRFVYDQNRGRPFWKTLLNITSPIGIAWVALGLLGQLLFTGRMLVQWWTSEREGRSVIPVAFWWMSIVGASMLLVYFIWRKDLVGVLGQSTGWLIYARNLHLIRSEDAASSQT